MVAKSIKVDPFDLVVFGATGGLAYRKLYPAILHREPSEELSAATPIIAVSRRPLDANGFRSSAPEYFSKSNSAGAAPADVIDRFLQRRDYVAADASSDADWDDLRTRLGESESLRSDRTPLGRGGAGNPASAVDGGNADRQGPGRRRGDQRRDWLGIPREEHLSHRPLPRKRVCAEPHGAAFRQCAA